MRPFRENDTDALSETMTQPYETITDFVQDNETTVIYPPPLFGIEVLAYNVWGYEP